MDTFLKGAYRVEDGQQAIRQVYSLVEVKLVFPRLMVSGEETTKDTNCCLEYLLTAQSPASISEGNLRASGLTSNAWCLSSTSKVSSDSTQARARLYSSSSPSRMSESRPSMMKLSALVLTWRAKGEKERSGWRWVGQRAPLSTHKPERKKPAA